MRRLQVLDQKRERSQGAQPRRTRRFGRALLRGCLLTLAIATTASAVSAQGTREVQAALDPSGGLMAVDASLARKLGVFHQQYPGFQIARLFQLSDGTYVLDVTVSQAGVTSRERMPMTRVEVDELRRLIAGRLALGAPEYLLDQSGRTRLVTGAAALGLGFYGWAVPVSFGIRDGSFTGVYMLTAGSTLFLAHGLTEHAEIRDADADLALYGATRGIAHGTAIAFLSDAHIDFQPTISLALLTSLAEGGTLFALSQSAQIDHGTAGAIEHLGDYGLLSGFGLAMLATEDDAEPQPARAAAALAGSALGMLGGRLYAEGRGLTRGDADVIGTSMTVCAYASGAVAELGTRDDALGRRGIAGAIAGGGAGLLLGDRLVRGRDFSRSDARLMAAGVAPGLMIGLGLAFVSGFDRDDSYLLSSAIGAGLGFAIVYRSLSERARTAAAQGPGADMLGSLRILPGPGALQLAGGGRTDQPWVMLAWQPRSSSNR